ncbi:MAG: DUF2029 domain-containing protein [Eudoraea sp.]|nr:DUF2029 domain-containing protein [Eudoraea sp.]
MTNKVITYWKLHKVAILLGILSAIFYFVFAYHLIRSDFIRLITLFAGLFLLCYKLIQFEKFNTRLLFGLGLIFRLVFLLAIPNLSQDFYRFIWDGQMIVNGLNPYLQLPQEASTELLNAIPNASELVSKMGNLSATNFSNYPPINQLAFAIAAFFGGSSIIGQVVALRIIVIGSDIGIFYFGRKVLNQINVSPHMIFWYFLNPLVIIELSGNLHFEGLMLFFFVLALYFIFRKLWVWAAICIGISISVKLIPLFFLPLFLSHYKIKKSIAFYLLTGIVILISLLPFFSIDMLSNFGNTLSLWFSNFEFNAGIYNAVKQLGVQLEEKPWEMIKTYGKLVPIAILVLVFFTTVLRNNKNPKILISSMLLILSAYYLLTPTVHPWYIIFLVFLCLGTEYRFPLFWSALVMLSYSAYGAEETKENLWLIFTEYFIVIAMLLYEFFRFNRENLFIRKNQEITR